MIGGAGSASLVLMYHRITDTDVDPWSLCVSPDHFAEQLAVLTRVTNPIPLSALWVDRDSRLARPSVVVTFDDGYADNLTNARPLLIAAGVPATVFVTSGAISSTREFWWDELEAFLLHPGPRPASLELRIGGDWHAWDLGESADYSADAWRRDRSWKTSNPPPGPRQATFLAVWRMLQEQPHAEQQLIMDALGRWAAVARHVRPAYRTLSESELRELASSPGINIGAHTVTHPVLPVAPPAAQWREISDCKAQLERLLKAPVTQFSYPYGAQTEESIALVGKAGYVAACSTRPGVVDAGTSRFLVPRVQVEDWTGADFEERLQAWLTAVPPGR